MRYVVGLFAIGSLHGCAEVAPSAGADTVAAVSARTEVVARAAAMLPGSRADTLQADLLLHGSGIEDVDSLVHRRATTMVLDSAAELIGRKDAAGARGLLGFVRAPLTESQQPTFAKLQARVVAAENAAAAERRIASILDGTRAEKTIEGTRCTKATRARVARLVRDHADWTDDMIGTVACGWVQIGMTARQLVASWGRPRDINRTATSYGVHEQWIYNDFGPYVYLEDGVVTSWQD